MSSLGNYVTSGIEGQGLEWRQDSRLDSYPHFVTERVDSFEDLTHFLVEDEVSVVGWHYEDGSYEYRFTGYRRRVDGSEGVDWSERVDVDDDGSCVRRSDNVKRSVLAIRREARLNGCYWMVTFTFPVRVFDLDEAKSYWVGFLRYARSHYVALRKVFSYRWIVVPEPHKSGAWHLHCLTNYPVDYRLGFILRTVWTKYLRERGMDNPSVRRFFVNFVQVNEGDLSRYVTKYVSKSVGMGVGKGRHCYWLFGHGKKPVRLRVDRDTALAFLRDLFGIGAKVFLIVVDGGNWRRYVIVARWSAAPNPQVGGSG